MIDTAPNRGDENAELFRLADLVLVPVRPSPSDLWAVSATVALLKRAGTPFLFVVNQATLNANITAQAIASLSHHGPVAETIIGTRVHYAAAMTDGHTAPELASRGPAAQEIAALWTNIKSCLHASMPSHQGDSPCLSPLPLPPTLSKRRRSRRKPQPRPAARRKPPKARKAAQMPLQVRLPREEVRAIKIAAAEREQTVSDFMLACFHAYMQSGKHA